MFYLPFLNEKLIVFIYLKKIIHKITIGTIKLNENFKIPFS